METMTASEIAATYLDDAGHLADAGLRKRIIDLRAEAKAAGDYAQADVCGVALAGDVDAIGECLLVMARS